MAIFDQRAELSRQKRHISADWDNDAFNKVLGFNKKGERNAWGKAIGMVPGLNTATHAIAKTRAQGSTKDVLNDTFDEAVGKDFAGLALGVSAAKTIAGGGIGGIGGGGGNMMDMFKGIGKGGIGNGADAATLMAGQSGSSDLAGAVNSLSGAEDMANVVGGGKKKGFTFNFGKNKEGEDTGMDFDLEGIGKAFGSKANKIQSENMKNPYEPGTQEYIKFESELELRQKDNNKGAFGEGIKDVIGSATGGNIFEAGANYAGSLIANKAATKDAVHKATRGEFAYNPEFNYL